MTDTPPSPTDPADHDLLASLYLDGEATADERAQVEADPVLMARVQAFKVMAADLANVAPPPDLGRMQISAALDLFDQQQAPPQQAAPSHTAPAATTAGVTSLADRRERKQSRGIPSWLGVAAAGALVLGGLGFASTLGGESDDATTDVAMESSADPSASAASRVQDDAPATTAADSDESFADDAMEESEEMDAMEEDTASDDGAAPVAEADTAGDDAADSAADEEAADIIETAPGPVPLDGLEADTAADYLALLGDQPLQPIENSPCAGSPLVEGLFGVDSFIPVVFDGVIASLLVQDGVPSTAVIVGPTCEIELE